MQWSLRHLALAIPSHQDFSFSSRVVVHTLINLEVLIAAFDDEPV